MQVQLCLKQRCGVEPFGQRGRLKKKLVGVVRARFGVGVRSIAHQLYFEGFHGPVSGHVRQRFLCRHGQGRDLIPALKLLEAPDMQLGVHQEVLWRAREQHLQCFVICTHTNECLNHFQVPLVIELALANLCGQPR